MCDIYCVYRAGRSRRSRHLWSAKAAQFRIVLFFLVCKGKWSSVGFELELSKTVFRHGAWQSILLVSKSCMSWQVRVCMSVFSCPGQTRTRVAWKLMRVDKREFVLRVFSTPMSWSNENKSCMRVDESWQARVCMRVFWTLMSWSNENKSCRRVDESWQARVCMRVFLTLMSWSNENKSCMRVDESWQARVCMRVFLTLMSWSN